MAKCYLFDIVDPVPDTIRESHWEKIFSHMVKSGWFESGGQRIGFITPVRYNRVIAAYFANEGRKRGVQYNENKEQIIPEPYDSFEHIFIILFEDTAQLLMQSRNIYDYVNLGFPIMRNNLLSSLADLFRLAGVYIVSKRGIRIESSGIKYTQEQLYSTFISIAQVKEFEVSGLSKGEIPLREDPKYKLFNPRVELDPIIWGAIADSIGHGLDHSSMTADESFDSSLQTPIPQALATIGNIEKVKGYDHNGNIVYRQRTEDAEIEIELPPEPTVVEALLDRILNNLDSRGRVDSWQERNNRRIDRQNNEDILSEID